MHDAGFPPGAFNLVNGDGASVGQRLASHPDVEMVSFTGSTRAGRAVSVAAAEGVKRVVLEWPDGLPALQYPPLVSMYRSATFILAIMLVAQACGTARRRAA